MKIDRLIAIIMVLLDRKRVSAPELARMFEVTTRTIHRDIDAINQAGIPIVTYTGTHGGVEILESYKVEKRLFNTTDITALLMGLGSIYSTLPKEEIVNTLAKIKGMIPKEQLNEIALRSRQIKIDMTPWHAQNNLSDTMITIKMAIELNQIIRFNYRDIKGEKSIRDIEPYRLLLKSMEWYVQGYCLARNDYRTFKLIRIKNIKILEQTFIQRDLNLAQLDNLLQIKFETMVPVKLCIHEEVMDHVSTYFGDECFEPYGQGKYIANVNLAMDDFGFRFLLGLGNKCECLEPIEIRERLQDIIREMNDIYKVYTGSFVAKNRGEHQL